MAEEDVSDLARERKRAANVEYKRNRRATDPEYLERIRAQNRAYKKRNREKVKASKRKWAKGHYERVRKPRLATDAAYRAKENEYQRVRKAKQLEAINADPELYRRFYDDMAENFRILRVRKAGRSKPTHCEICGEREGDAFRTKLCFDHCHASGKFRGWICHRCNIALGNLRDSVKIARKLVEYLETHTQK